MWAAEAAWATAKRIMEMNQVAANKAQAALRKSLDSAVAVTAYQKLHAAEARLEVRQTQENTRHL